MTSIGTPSTPGTRVSGAGGSELAGALPSQKRTPSCGTQAMPAPPAASPLKTLGIAACADGAQTSTSSAPTSTKSLRTNPILTRFSRLRAGPPAPVSVQTPLQACVT